MAPSAQAAAAARPSSSRSLQARSREALLPGLRRPVLQAPEDLPHRGGLLVALFSRPQESLVARASFQLWGLRPDNLCLSPHNPQRPLRSEQVSTRG